MDKEKLNGRELTEKETEQVSGGLASVAGLRNVECSDFKQSSFTNYVANREKWDKLYEYCSRCECLTPRGCYKKHF